MHGRGGSTQAEEERLVPPHIMMTRWRSLEAVQPRCVAMGNRGVPYLALH